MWTNMDLQICGQNRNRFKAYQGRDVTTTLCCPTTLPSAWNCAIPNVPASPHSIITTPLYLCYIDTLDRML